VGHWSSKHPAKTHGHPRKQGKPREAVAAQAQRGVRDITSYHKVMQDQAT